MKIVYIDETDPCFVINGHAYDLLEIADKKCKIIDETGEVYWYPLELFRLVR